MQTEVEIMNPYACKSTRIISEKGTIFSKCLRNMQTNQTQRHVLHVFLSKKTSSCLHANIVQRVKSCYKIKINYRESKSCFYGFLQHRSHPCQPSKTQNALTAPILQSKSVTITRQ